MLERYKGNDGDPWHDNPIYMTGPAVLTNTTQRYLKLPYPVSGFLGKIYHVSLLSWCVDLGGVRGGTFHYIRRCQNNS